MAIPRRALLARNNFRLAVIRPEKCMNVLGNKERQIFRSLSARTMLQLMRIDLFSLRAASGSTTMAEITTAARRPSSRPASSSRPWATNRLSSRYARHKSIHVAIKICLGEVQRLNGI